jgi:hypothetical protein
MKSLLAKTAAAVAVIGLTPIPAEAQQRSGGSGAERVRQVVVYGREPCPRGKGDEVVICARRPEAERYRIPRNLRDATAERRGQSWAARARSLEYVGRTGIQSCSPVGPGGFTGCWEQMMRSARDERAAADRGE